MLPQLNILMVAGNVYNICKDTPGDDVPGVSIFFLHLKKTTKIILYSKTSLKSVQIF